jgi:hypothetical protein
VLLLTHLCSFRVFPFRFEIRFNCYSRVARLIHIQSKDTEAMKMMFAAKCPVTALYSSHTELTIGCMFSSLKDRDDRRREHDDEREPKDKVDDKSAGMERNFSQLRHKEGSFSVALPAKHAAVITLAPALGTDDTVCLRCVHFDGAFGKYVRSTISSCPCTVRHSTLAQFLRTAYSSSVIRTNRIFGFLGCLTFKAIPPFVYDCTPGV